MRTADRHRPAASGAQGGAGTRVAPVGVGTATTGRRVVMLHYAVVFFVIALIAAVLGFGRVAGLSADIGWLFAVLAVVILVVSVLGGAFHGGAVP
jgi:uncharacterized membrane protein YtjA (UPF0391 family)